MAEPAAPVSLNNAQMEAVHHLHGPCLARNPELADLLLSRVIGPLAPLELSEVDQLRRERLAAPRRV